MNSLIFESLYILVLAGFLGFEVIRRVPPLLHTPLMSTTNAISGISLVGSLVAAGSGQGIVSTVLGTIAVTGSPAPLVAISQAWLDGCVQADEGRLCFPRGLAAARVPVSLPTRTAWGAHSSDEPPLEARQ